jgi:hypothetical protein
VGKDAIPIKRLGLPAGVHFSRGAELRVASLYAAILSSGNAPSGTWVPADDFVAKV